MPPKRLAKNENDYENDSFQKQCPSLFNGHSVQRKEKIMWINCSTNILFNGHNVQRIYRSMDL